MWKCCCTGLKSDCEKHRESRKHVQVWQTHVGLKAFVYFCSLHTIPSITQPNLFIYFNQIKQHEPVLLAGMLFCESAYMMIWRRHTREAGYHSDRVYSAPVVCNRETKYFKQHLKDKWEQDNFDEEATVSSLLRSGMNGMEAKGEGVWAGMGICSYDRIIAITRLIQ